MLTNRVHGRRWQNSVSYGAFGVLGGLVLRIANGDSITFVVGGIVVSLSFVTGVGAGVCVDGSIGVLEWSVCVLHTFSRG